MERSYSYFIIPFKAENKDNRFDKKGWKAVEKLSTCELHNYITDRFFDKENPVCRIWDYHFDERVICDNRDENQREITLPFVRVYAYTSGISFAAFCLEYDMGYSVDDVIGINSRLKYLETDTPANFTYKTEEKESISGKDNVFARLLKKVMGNVEICSTKALLFVFALCPAELMNKGTMFYLSTGNNRKFRYNDSMKFDSYTQSENVLQGLSREGIARIVSEDSDRFFTDKNYRKGLIGNYRENYLWVYIILLCQYYGFKDYNNKALTLYTGNVRKNSFRTRRQMEQLSTEADLFYLQNVHSDVSQITHQNRIYEMLFEIYGISALIDDFKEDLSICNRLLEKEKLNSKMFVIILTTSVAAIAGVVEILANFTSLIDFIFG